MSQLIEARTPPLPNIVKADGKEPLFRAGETVRMANALPVNGPRNLLTLVSCHTDRCPTGVSTQNRSRQRALIVADKSERVFNFHRATIELLAELVAAAGLDHPTQFRPSHFSRRVSPHEVMSFAELYPSLQPGELLADTSDRRFRVAWAKAHPAEFRAVA